MPRSVIWKRWNSWTLPTRLTLLFSFIGLILAAFQLFEVPQKTSAWLWPASPPPYDLALQSSISALHRSDICLTSRLIEVEPDENRPEIDDNDVQPACRIDLSSLEVFATNYTNYLAQVPYSGAESFKDFVRVLKKAELAINDAQTVDQLRNSQNSLNMSLAEVGFWMCGMEWHLRSAPEGPGPESQPFRGVNLTATWDEWDRKSGKAFTQSVERRKNYQYMSKPNDCSGFIDLID